MERRHLDKSGTKHQKVVSEELSNIIAELRKLIGYASEVEQSIAPSITVIPTLLANLTSELKNTREALERLSEEIS